MGATASIKQESSLDGFLSRKAFFFDNATAQYFVSAESKQIGISIDCSWNQPLMLNIRIVDGDKIYRPTDTQIFIRKKTSEDSNSACGILTFYKPINVGDPICDGPESLSAHLLAESEVFEGICNIIFKYKQQVGIKIEAKNIKEDIWDVTKEKSLVVADFSVFTKKTDDKDAEVLPKKENNIQDNQENSLPALSNQLFENLFLQKIRRLIKRIFW